MAHLGVNAGKDGVFAELLRSFGVFSETLPVWRISLKTNLMLVAVVFLTFSLEVGGHHDELLARVLKHILLLSLSRANRR